MFEISEKVGDQCLKAQQAQALLRSVLAESEYILKPGTYEADRYIMELPRLTTLMFLAENILLEIVPALEEVQDEILHHREQKKPRAKTTELAIVVAG